MHNTGSCMPDSSAFCGCSKQCRTMLEQPKQAQQSRHAFRTAFRLHKKAHRAKAQSVCRASAATSERAALEAADKWIEKILNTIYTEPTNGRVNSHQQECLEVLKSQRMPTTRHEEYRFTDVSLLLRSEPQLASGDISRAEVEERSLSETSNAITLVMVNGHFQQELSNIGDLPRGAYIGNLGKAPGDLTNELGGQARTRGGPFAVLNGALNEEVLCISLEDTVELERPIHVLHFNTGAAGSSLPISTSRLLVKIKERSSCQIIEEFISRDTDGQRFTNSVAEIFLEEAALLKHKYIELEGSETWHMKASLVKQAASSRYHLTEAQLGGKLTRHDVSIQQTGPDTETVLKAFLLCGPSQLHDLHSKLKLEHPRAVANQLHKCIVSASSGKGVFDGNVKVERFAQQTDAAQLSRNILLSPKATVNVKPNLQIVADDVKCSHGCAVSDLEDDQLFYFRTRGIDYATARQVLVYSFGAEVTNDFQFEHLVKRIQSYINSTLAKAPLS